MSCLIGERLLQILSLVYLFLFNEKQKQFRKKKNKKDISLFMEKY